MDASLSHFLWTRRQAKKLYRQLKSLRRDPNIAADLAFREDVNSLLEKHGRNYLELMTVLGSERNLDAYKSKPVKRRWPTKPMMTFRNPFTGREIITRGYNQLELNEWRTAHGDRAVRSWLVDIEYD